ncbi:MAG: hypothetical protein HYV63_00815 [Candidatus Schekmanbacteria bacterium]|nr:hypothetical protein [Candidatus Schekmanbacteria bacterium]
MRQGYSRNLGRARSPGLLPLLVTALLAAGRLVPGPAPAQAAIFALGPWSGEVLLGVDALQRRGVRAGDTRSLGYRGQLSLGKSVSFLDAGILSCNAGVSAKHASRSTTVAGDGIDFDNDFLGYNLWLGILQAKRVSLEATANRAATVGEESLGSRRLSETQDWSTALSFRFRPLRATLRYSNAALDETISERTLNGDRRRRERVRRLAVDARSTKLGLLAERTWFTQPDTSEEYLVDTLAASHAFNWGKGSTLRTAIDGLDRGGVNPVRSLRFGESARIQHTESLASVLSIRHTTERRQQSLESLGAQLSIQHKLYSNLTSAVSLSGARTRYAASRDDTLGTAVSLSYRKGLPHDGAIQIGLGTGMQASRSTMADDEIRATSENHRIDDSRLLGLRQPNALTGTIVVTNEREQEIYELGVDYTILEDGPPTQLLVLEGGRIKVGQIVVVSYQFRAPGKNRDRSESYELNAAVDFQWINLSQSVSLSREGSPASAASGERASTLNSVTGADLSWGEGNTRASAGVSYRHLLSFGARTTSYTVRGALSFQPSAAFSLNLSAKQVYASTTSRAYHLADLDLGASWRISRALWAQGQALASYRAESNGVREQFARATVTLGFGLGMIDLELEHSLSMASGFAGNSIENRLTTQIRRKL